MVLRVNHKTCTSCGVCERICPFGAIVIVPETRKVKVLENCILCGSCTNACSFKALSVELKAVSETELAEYKGVFVWGEWEKKGEKTQIKKVVFQLLGKGRELADKLDETLCAIIVGKDVEHLVPKLFHYGADNVCVCEHNMLWDYSTDGYTTVITSVIASKKPSIVLYGATPNGRDLAPRIAARLGLGLTADCTRLDINGSRQLVQTRPTFGGNIMASILSPYTRPQMSTVRPNVFTKPVPDTSRTGTIEKVEVNLKPLSVRTEVLEEVIVQNKATKIEEADQLISIGRGIGGKETLDLINELAKELNAMVSSSRALVDLGWVSHTQQVGQSGKTVAPKVYMALGISGAIQHLVGMRSSDIIIAINKDPEAPIFKVANFGIVGDIFEIIPEFLEVLKAHNEKLSAPYAKRSSIKGIDVGTP